MSNNYGSLVVVSGEEWSYNQAGRIAVDRNGNLYMPVIDTATLDLHIYKLATSGSGWDKISTSPNGYVGWVEGNIFSIPFWVSGKDRLVMATMNPTWYNGEIMCATMSVWRFNMSSWEGAGGGDSWATFIEEANFWFQMNKTDVWPVVKDNGDVTLLYHAMTGSGPYYDRPIYARLSGNTLTKDISLGTFSEVYDLRPNASFGDDLGNIWFMWRNYQTNNVEWKVADDSYTLGSRQSANFENPIGHGQPFICVRDSTRVGISLFIDPNDDLFKLFCVSSGSAWTEQVPMHDPGYDMKNFTSFLTYNSGSGAASDAGLLHFYAFSDDLNDPPLLWWVHRYNFGQGVWTEPYQSDFPVQGSGDWRWNRDYVDALYSRYDHKIHTRMMYYRYDEYDYTTYAEWFDLNIFDVVPISLRFGRQDPTVLWINRKGIPFMDSPSSGSLGNFDWKRQDGSAVNIWQSIDEYTEDNADYITSRPKPTGQIAREKLTPMTVPYDFSYIYMRYSYWRDAPLFTDPSINYHLKVRLVYGDAHTVVAEWTHTNVVSTTPITVNQLLTSQQAGLIPSNMWGELYLEYEAYTT